jgi:hypothetical protein
MKGSGEADAGVRQKQIKAAQGEFRCHRSPAEVRFRVIELVV